MSLPEHVPVSGWAASADPRTIAVNFLLQPLWELPAKTVFKRANNMQARTS